MAFSTDSSTYFSFYDLHLARQRLQVAREMSLLSREEADSAIRILQELERVITDGLPAELSAEAE